MKRIAFWSRDHKMAARIMIAICHLLIFSLGCYVGSGLKKNNIFIAPAVFWIFVMLFLVVTFSFSRSYDSFSFLIKKILDGLILISGFVMITCFINQKNINTAASYNTLHGSFSQKNVSTADSNSKPTNKELKKQLKEFKKALKEDKATTGGIILAILVAAALGMVLAAGTCSLACNGQNALAILLFLGGVTAIFFICRAIIRGTRRSNDKAATPKYLQPNPTVN